MRAMASDFFATNPLMAGPQVAMLIFLAVFGVVLWRVIRARAADYDHHASLPLQGEGSLSQVSMSDRTETNHE